MGKLILVRHGQTQMNADRIYFGKLNPALNEKGRSQALAAKGKLEAEELSYDEVYCSPLRRCKETAEVVNYLAKEIHWDPRLEELDFGIFEGLKLHEIQQQYPKEYQKSVEDWQNYNYEGGESPQDLQNRSVDFFLSLDEAKDYLVVTHWGVICTFLSYVMSKDLESYWKFKVLNGGVVVLEIRDAFPILEKFI